MRQARARLVLLALVVTGVASGMVPAQAGANYTFFSCTDLASGTWCDGRPNGSYDGEDSWDYAEAWDVSGNTVEVCQRVYKPSTSGYLAGNSCANDYVSHYYGNVICVCYDAQVRQNAGSPYTTNGFADSAWTP